MVLQALRIAHHSPTRTALANSFPRGLLRFDCFGGLWHIGQYPGLWKNEPVVFSFNSCKSRSVFRFEKIGCRRRCFCKRILSGRWLPPGHVERSLGFGTAAIQECLPLPGAAQPKCHFRRRTQPTWAIQHGTAAGQKKSLRPKRRRPENQSMIGRIIAVIAIVLPTAILMQATRGVT